MDERTRNAKDGIICGAIGRLLLQVRVRVCDSFSTAPFFSLSRSARENIWRVLSCFCQWESANSYFRVCFDTCWPEVTVLLCLGNTHSNARTLQVRTAILVKCSTLETNYGPFPLADTIRDLVLLSKSNTWFDRPNKQQTTTVLFHSNRGFTFTSCSKETLFIHIFQRRKQETDTCRCQHSLLYQSVLSRLNISCPVMSSSLWWFGPLDLPALGALLTGIFLTWHLLPSFNPFTLKVKWYILSMKLWELVESSFIWVSQVLHTGVWCNISGEDAGEIWNWYLIWEWKG